MWQTFKHGHMEITTRKDVQTKDGSPSSLPHAICFERWTVYITSENCNMFFWPFRGSEKSTSPYEVAFSSQGYMYNIIIHSMSYINFPFSSVLFSDNSRGKYLALYLINTPQCSPASG